MNIRTKGTLYADKYTMLKFLCASILPISIVYTLRDFVCTITLDNMKYNLRNLEKDCESLKDYCNLIQNFRNPFLPFYKPLSSGQKECEILHLLAKASRLGLRSVVEIGTGAGGATYLLCKAAQKNATIITLDIDMPKWRKRLLKAYALPGQTVMAIKADSHRQDTVRCIAELLHGDKLDFLFIDGDHSYHGIKQDFLDYSPLVRKGGWIAFHDIAPDYRTRYGIQTSSYTGDVPQFWEEIKHKFKHFEIMEDPRQDGFGMGVLIWE